MNTDERLQEIRDQLLGLRTDLALHLQRCEDNEERILGLQQTVYGKNGSEPGLRIELDRLKVAGERGRWFARAALGALIVVAVGAVWGLLLKR